MPDGARPDRRLPSPRGLLLSRTGRAGAPARRAARLARSGVGLLAWPGDGPLPAVLSPRAVDPRAADATRTTTATSGARRGRRPPDRGAGARALRGAVRMSSVTPARAG